MERLDPMQLNHNAAALAIWAYSVAQLPELLPRDQAAPPAPAPASSTGKGLSQNTIIYIVAGVIGGLVVVTLLAAYFWRSRSDRAKTEKARGDDAIMSEPLAHEDINSSSHNKIWATAPPHVQIFGRWDGSK